MQQQTFDSLTPAQLAMVGGPSNVMIDPSVPAGQIRFTGGQDRTGAREYGGMPGSNAAHKPAIDPVARRAKRKASKQARRASR